MSQYVMFADLGEKVVITDATEHPEPRPVPGAVARPGTPAPSPAAPTAPVPRSCEPGRRTGGVTYARRPTAITATAHPDSGPRKIASPSESPTRVQPCRSTSWIWTASPWATRWSRSRTKRGSGASGPPVTSMADTQAQGWRHPNHHVARSIESADPGGAGEPPDARRAHPHLRHERGRARGPDAPGTPALPRRAGDRAAGRVTR